METIKKLFFVSRPVSWVNTAYPFAAGFLATGGQLDLRFLITTLYFLIPYNLLMYGVNDVFDYESDIRNPRKGGIEGMREQRAFHPVILWATGILNIPFIVYILLTGTVLSGLVFVVLLFFVVAYSLGGLRFKEKPFLDSITSSLHFVGPLIYALTLTGVFVWPYIVAFFLWGMASHAFGAVQDIIPDRQGKLASIATVLGARVTVIFCLILYIVAAALVIAQGWPALVVGLAGLLYVANTAAYLTITDKTSMKANAGWRRFIWLNLASGFVVTMVLLLQYI